MGGPGVTWQFGALVGSCRAARGDNRKGGCRGKGIKLKRPELYELPF